MTAWNSRATPSAKDTRSPEPAPGLSRIQLIPEFVKESQADVWLSRILAETPWTQHRIRMFGREILVPRLSAWYGNAGAHYAYSGLSLDLMPWTGLLLGIRAAVESMTPGRVFNSVLLNQYRDGRDSVSWHADDEPELGPSPFIASLSLGHARDFLLKPKVKSRPGEKQETRSYRLSHGSLLLMGEGTQEEYLHCLPKRPGWVVESPRVNLTFRQVGD